LEKFHALGDHFYPKLEGYLGETLSKLCRKAQKVS
jgi:hypothetical protein